MSNLTLQSPFLREQRQFPFDDLKQLARQNDESYIDIASKVNLKTIGTYALNSLIQNGKTWYLKGGNQKQQGLRKVYLFTDSSLIQNHNIDFTSVDYISTITGTFFDGTFWQTLPYVDVIAATNQINIKLSATQIIVTKGVGAPAIVKGLIIIEYISIY